MSIAESAPVRPIVRNARFDLGNVPRHWHGGRRALTAFFDNLSIFFPAGERFFVAAVKRHAKLATDEKLRAEVDAFCAQEGFHSREHVRYNKMLALQGYPARELEQRVERILRFFSRVLPPRFQLSATCALEHFTATLAHVVLERPAILDGADPTMAALWRWHAAEENEHKAVAFDLYQLAGGNWPERAAIMVATTVIFWTLVAMHQVRFMRTDGTLWSPGEWRSLLHFLWVEPGGMATMTRIYLDYYRPGFHPWQLDNRELIEKWREAAEVG